MAQNLTYGNTTVSSPNQILYSNPNGILSWSQPKQKYWFLGNEIEIEGSYLDANVAIILASIETMGWTFYESLIRNRISFQGDLKIILDREYGVWKRENKIESILETKD